MNLKWQFGLFLAVLFIGISVLVFMQFRESLWYLGIAEGLIVLLIIFAFALYTRIFRPLNQLNIGSEALKHHDFTNKMKYTDSKEMNNLVTVYNNMIDNIRKERVYQQEQHFFLNSLIDALPVGIIILDYNDRLSEYNSKAEKMLLLSPGYIGKSIYEVDARLEPAVHRNETADTFNFRTNSNKYYRVLVNKFMHRGFSRKFIILEDVSSEVIYIEQRSYGKVIRMMAHEVNNSVGAINSILDSLRSGSHMNENEVREYMGVIHERNKNLNRFMNNFADVVRIPPPNFVDVNLNSLVKRVYLLMKSRAYDPEVVMDLILPEEIVFTRIDPDQMEQVLINVILNALEAIKGKGNVTVALRDHPRSIQILDTGSGISGEIAENIFTPFFSSKPTGQGIGLTMVRDILNNHRFPYNLESADGITTFEIKLNPEN